MQNNKQLYKPYCSEKCEGQPMICRQSVINTSSSVSNKESDT